MALLHIDQLPRNATPGELLRLVPAVGKIDAKRVGKIARLGNAATVEVPDPAAPALVTSLDGATFRDRQVRVRLTRLARSDASHVAHFDLLAKLLHLEAEAEREQLRQRAARGVADDGTTL